MSLVRAFMMVLAGLAIGPLLSAQTAPQGSLPPGDAVRGKSLFESSKQNCLGCHRVGKAGSLFGPDLSAIGIPPRGGTPATGRGGAAPTPAPAATATSQTQQLAQSIVDPNAVVSVQNRYITVKLKDGTTATGKLLNIDTFGVQMFDSNEKLVNIPRADVRDMTMVSPMPSYRDKLSTQELADIVAYLMTLKGQ